MAIQGRLERALEARRAAGLAKTERILTSPQAPEVRIEGRAEPVLNFCANNYLGLANHPRVVAAARAAMDEFGYGLSSVRFICGTQSIHKRLEARISRFLGTDDTILYTSCFDANGGLFESLLEPGDALISARLNHASIIDGVRLTKCRRLTYAESDPDDLARALAEAGPAGEKLVVTDGVFSMDGTLAPLDRIAPLAAARGALLAVDDSHATGFVGAGGRGTGERFGVKPDIITSTLGKALGGASGGFTSGGAVIVEWLRNNSRPYLFSNSLPPGLVAGALAALDVVESDEGAALRGRLAANTARFRAAMAQAGFRVPAGEHPIVPVMLGDALVATCMAARLLDLGVYVTGFSYPVVPQGAARIRVQLSAAHTPEQVDRAVGAFAAAAR
jgi:glycine C-acetyltransferase